MIRRDAEPIPAELDDLAAVLFDAGNTLLGINTQVIAASASAEGHPVDAAAVRDAEWRARPRFDARLRALGSTETAVAFRTYCRTIFEEIGIAPGAAADAAIERIATYNRSSNLWDVPIEGAREALRDLGRAGYRLGVISNSRGTIHEHLRRLDLANDLSFVIDSAVVGIEKPDPRIFRLALAELGLPAGRCAYVGDIYSVDVMGARGAGLRGILVDPGNAWLGLDCLRVRSVPDLRDRLLGVRRET